MCRRVHDIEIVLVYLNVTYNSVFSYAMKVGHITISFVRLTTPSQGQQNLDRPPSEIKIFRAWISSLDSSPQKSEELKLNFSLSLKVKWSLGLGIGNTWCMLEIILTLNNGVGEPKCKSELKEGILSLRNHKSEDQGGVWMLEKLLHWSRNLGFILLTLPWEHRLCPLNSGIVMGCCPFHI